LETHFRISAGIFHANFSMLEMI